MIVTIRTLAATLMCLMFACIPARADETHRPQIELGVEAYTDGDFERAKSILMPLADAGHPVAINLIGLMHKKGKGFPVAPDVACDLFERSANLGYESAMYNLSRCYGQGFGRPKNRTTEHEWLTKAANNGFVRAMIVLIDHEHSTSEENQYWLKTAAKHGSKFAASKLWIDGHREDAPNFTLLDELCVSVRILLLGQSIFSCDE